MVLFWFSGFLLQNMAYEGLWEPVQSRYCSKGPEKDRRDNGEVMERVLLYQWWGGARTMQECREWVGIGRGKLQHRPGWVLCRKTRRAIGVLGKTGNCTFEVGKSDFRIRPLRIAKSGDHGGKLKHQFGSERCLGKSVNLTIVLL